MFAHRHATGVDAQNLVVEAIETGLALGDQLRLEAAAPVAWDRNLDLRRLGQDRLRARAVATVAAAAAGGDRPSRNPDAPSAPRRARAQSTPSAA